MLLLLYSLAFWPQGMWDPSSLDREQNRTPCIGRQSPNHWTAKEVSWTPMEYLKNWLCTVVKSLSKYYSVDIMYGIIFIMKHRKLEISKVT